MAAVRIRGNTYPKTDWRCRLFGHYWSAGWWGSYPYFEVRNGGHDNIGRIHGDLYMTCDRCGKKVLAGHMHINDKAITEALGREKNPQEQS